MQSNECEAMTWTDMKHAFAQRNAAITRADQAERERDEALASAADWASRFAQAAERVEQVERERDEARAELRGHKLDALGQCFDIERHEAAVAIGTTRSGRVVYSPAGERALLGADVPACAACPGRAACDCPAGEHCPGTVAP